MKFLLKFCAHRAQPSCDGPRRIRYVNEAPPPLRRIDAAPPQRCLLDINRDVIGQGRRGGPAARPAMPAMPYDLRPRAAITRMGRIHSSGSLQSMRGNTEAAHKPPTLVTAPPPRANNVRPKHMGLYSLQYTYTTGQKFGITAPKQTLCSESTRNAQAERPHGRICAQFLYLSNEHRTVAVAEVVKELYAKN